MNLMRNSVNIRSSQTYSTSGDALEEVDILRCLTVFLQSYFDFVEIFMLNTLKLYDYFPIFNTSNILNHSNVCLYKKDGVDPFRGSANKMLFHTIFVFKIANYLIDSPDLLVQLNFIVPQFQTRHSSYFCLSIPRTNILAYFSIFSWL